MRNALLLLAFVPFLAFGQELHKYGYDTTATVPTGLPEGMYVPLFSAPDENKVEQSLEHFLKQGSVVLVFTQGSWSRHCRKFVSKLQNNLEEIGHHGAQVLVVTPEKTEFIEKFKSKTGAEFNIVSDTHGMVAENYDVAYTLTKSRKRRYNFWSCAKLDERNAKDGSMMIVPAIYVIAPSGRIAYHYFNYDRRQRPEVRTIIESLNGLANERK